MEALRGGSGNDTFQITGTGSVGSSVNGGGGTDTLDYSALTSNVTVNLAIGGGTAIHGGSSGGIVAIENIIGSVPSGGLNYLYGPSSATTYTLTSATAGSTSGGTSFSNFQRLVGNGSDTIDGPNVNAAWLVTGSNAGQISAGGTLVFSGVKNLQGGTANDTYQFSPAGSITGNLGDLGGSNWLDYSHWTTAVVVNLFTHTATGIGNSVTSVQNVIGGGGNDSITGGAAGILAGGAGNDTISAGQGRSILIGGSGNDSLTSAGTGDILIAGTSYDPASASESALLAILAEWQRTDETYATRIANIKSGGGVTPGNTLVFGSSVKDDGGSNTLTGNPAATGDNLDWFFANQAAGHDTIVNQLSGEQVN
jgi:hypothetical protein